MNIKKLLHKWFGHKFREVFKAEIEVKGVLYYHTIEKCSSCGMRVHRYSPAEQGFYDDLAERNIILDRIKSELRFENIQHHNMD